ncbi:MAG: hypothetical protein JO295_13600 [Verrucomicrobia bacterium]|nr:hypothetical protein [Verrucomicrobiota bacterium]
MSNPYASIFQVRVEGADLVCAATRATWFGGGHDPDDSGDTASGFSTKKNPGCFGCALPLDFNRPRNNPCAGSPLGIIPWFTPVAVTNLHGGGTVQVKLIDLGPSAPPNAHAGIDLTVAAFEQLGGNLRVGELTVSWRIIGGAKFLRKGAAVA